MSQSASQALSCFGEEPPPSCLRLQHLHHPWHKAGLPCLVLLGRSIRVRFPGLTFFLMYIPTSSLHSHTCSAFFSQKLLVILYLIKRSAWGRWSAGSPASLPKCHPLVLVFLPLGGFSPFLTLRPPSSLRASGLPPCPSALGSDVISSRTALTSQSGLHTRCQCSANIPCHLCHSLCLGYCSRY